MKSTWSAMPSVVFAAISAQGDCDTSDNPPLHVFTMSIGCMIGRLLATKEIRPQDAKAAMEWIAGKTSVEEIKNLIWNHVDDEIY